MKQTDPLRGIRRLMLLTLLLFASSVTVFAAMPADTPVSINFKSEQVTTVLKEVQKQSGLNFFYSTEVSKEWPRITIRMTKKPASEVVAQIASLIGCEYTIKGNIVTISKQKVSGRERTIKGYVRDDSGEPLVGVPVCIGESRVCTVTDADGFYTFKIPVEKTVLKFSYVGMENAYVTISQGNSDVSRDVAMHSDSQLEEVVVTGYQDISKPKMTGSVTTITADKLNDRYTTNVMNNLEGRVPGLTVYGGKMTIRGTSSLFAETQPLLVVDGLPIEGRIEDLNPSDIATINVLKDAAATAIYGARASNGIIVVTTKSAKGKGKVDIDFSTNLTVYENRNMDYHDNFYMNAEEQVNKEAEYWDYYFLNNNGEVSDPIGSTNSDILDGSRQISPIRHAYYQLAQGQISRQQLDQLLNQLRQNNYAKEYADNVLRRQVIQQYNLSLRGRSEKMQNNLTLNFRTDNSGQINSYEKAFNVNYKGSYELAKWLTGIFSVNGIFEKTLAPGTDINAQYTDPWSVPAYETMYNADGTRHPLYYLYCGNPYMELADGIYDLGVNAVDEMYNNSQTMRRNHWRLHGELQFNIIDGLTFNTKFIYENDRSTTDWLATDQSHVTRTIRNAYAQPNPTTGRMTYMTPENGGLLRTTNTNGRYWTFRAQANYDKSFGKHAINAIAGLEFRETIINGSRALQLGYDDQLKSSNTSSVNFGSLSGITYSPYYLQSSFPALYYVYEPYLRNGMGVEAEEHHRFGSGYMNATYTYDDRYNLFASVRKDYADVYGLNAKFRGRPLWSVGAGWNIHNESFTSDVKWINVLKLRFSYGVTGNIYQGATSYMTATSSEINRYTGLPRGEVESPANPNLKWEQSRTTNIGIDFSLFSNRMRGALDYYNKVGRDIFSNRSLDPITGFTSMFMNTASLRNRGIELAISYDWLRPTSENRIGWSTNLTFSHNSNKITSVENPATTATQLIETPYREGYPTSALWSYRFAGISAEEGDRGGTLWYIEEGNTAHQAQSRSIDVLEFSGQTDPKVVMGIDNTLTWKGFSFGLLMAYYSGHKMRALTQDEVFRMPYSALPSYYVNSWTPENNSSVPGIGRYYPSSTSTEETRHENTAVYSADFLKIRNIVLGYEIPQTWCRSIGINRLSLRVQIDNPKYLWVKNDMKVDPETLGVRNPSSVVFGLNVNL